MLSISRVIMIGLLSVGITAATAAQAGTVKLFTASWYANSFGNHCKGTKTPGGLAAPYCTRTTPDFTKYELFAVPQGQLCNASQPRCPIESTPTSGMAQGNFHPLGGFNQPTVNQINCAPLSTYGTGNTVRPAKGATST